MARYTPPASNGRSPVTGYMVTALPISPTGRVVAQTTSALQAARTRSPTMSLPADNYRFVLRARNAAGLSATSARSNLVHGAVTP